MLPDLGKYATVVLGSYGASIVLLVALVAWTLWKGARVKAALRAIEGRQGQTDHG